MTRNSDELIVEKRRRNHQAGLETLPKHQKIVPLVPRKEARMRLRFDALLCITSPVGPTSLLRHCVSIVRKNRASRVASVWRDPIRVMDGTPLRSSAAKAQ